MKPADEVLFLGNEGLWSLRGDGATELIAPRLPFRTKAIAVGFRYVDEPDTFPKPEIYVKC